MAHEKQPHYGRSTQEPDVQDNDRGETISKHPAYSQISVSRVSGGAALYGSDFLHQGYIRIRVASSVLQRSLSNDLAIAQLQPLIEVDMSESQWASLISSLNIGMGTQCTLRSLSGETVPGLPVPQPRTEQFARENQKRMAGALASLAELEQLVVSSGLSQSKQRDILTKARATQANISTNIQFVADQFDEHMEATVEKARVEINAYANGVLNRPGLQAIAGQGPRQVLELAGYQNEGVAQDTSNELQPEKP